MQTTVADITDRQLEIIAAAGKILSVSGVSGLTTKNLAREMGFSESAIYRHFKSREQIIIALLQYLADQLDRHFAEAVSSEQSPVGKFKALFRGQFTFFKAQPYFAVAVFSDGLMEESRRVNECITAIMAVKKKYLVPLIKAGQRDGSFTTAVSTEELAHIVMGAVRLHMFKWRAEGFESDVKRSGENLIRALLTLMTAGNK